MTPGIERGHIQHIDGMFFTYFLFITYTNVYLVFESLVFCLFWQFCSWHITIDFLH